MATVSDNYLVRLEQYIMGGYRLRSSAMSIEQKLRTMIVSDAYSKWRQNEDAKIEDLLRRSAILVYDTLLRSQHTDPLAADIVRTCHITEGKKRTYGELHNDLKAFDHIVGIFSVDTFNADKVKYVNGSKWLIDHGMLTGNDRSVTSGLDRLSKIHNEFQKGDQIAENIANTERVITSDISVIIPGRENTSQEERDALNKRFGMVGIVDMEPNEDGVYETRYESTAERREDEREKMKDGFEHLEDRLGLTPNT